MKRKFSLVILMSLSTLSAPAWSLGVGEARVASALGAPLRAIIPLTDTQGVSPQALTVSLADAEGYRRVGLQRSLLLDGLALTVVPQSGGLAVRVRSERPVREPYLDLLVELGGPDGRQRRQVTLLFDPPGFGSQSVISTTSRSASLQQTDGDRETAVSLPPAPAPDTSSGPSRAAVEREAGYVNVGETLWRVATRLRPDAGISMSQMMMALRDANPAAFPGGNINRLRAGYVLDVPSREQIVARSAQEAKRQVQAQNRAFSRGEPVPDMASVTAPAGASDTATGSASDNASDNAHIDGALATSTLEQEGESAGAASTGKPDEPAASAADRQPKSQSQSQSDSRPDDVADTPRLTLLTDAQIESEAKAEAAASVSSGQDERLDRLEARLEQSQQSLATVRAERDQTRAELASLREEVAGLRDTLSTLTSGPSSSMAQAADERAGGGFVDRYLMPLWAMIGQVGRTLSGQLAAAGLVVLLSLWWLVRRRREADSAQAAGAVEESSMFAGSPMREGKNEIEDEAEPVAGNGDTPGRFAQETKEALMPRAEAVSEADIFMAYGRYDQARVLLEEGLDAEPERHDLRLKLIKVLVEQGHWQDVHAEAERLGGDDDPARQSELIRLLAREHVTPTGAGAEEELNAAEQEAVSAAATVDEKAEASPTIALAPVELAPAFRPPIEREPVAFDGKGRLAPPSWQQGEDVSPEQVSEALQQASLGHQEASEVTDDIPGTSTTAGTLANAEQGDVEREDGEWGDGDRKTDGVDAVEASSNASEPPQSASANVIDYRPPSLEVDTAAPEETPMQPSVEFVQAEEDPAIGEDAASDLAELMRDADQGPAAMAADEDSVDWDVEEVAFEPLHLDNGHPADSPPVTGALVGEAEARLEQGDHAQARDLLDRALEEGDGETREQANRMIAQHNL